jgi:hypothetical protein
LASTVYDSGGVSNTGGGNMFRVHIIIYSGFGIAYMDILDLLVEVHVTMLDTLIKACGTCVYIILRLSFSSAQNMTLSLMSNARSPNSGRGRGYKGSESISVRLS